MLWYTKSIIFWVKGLKIVANRCLNLSSFHDDLCCCFEFSNIENQVDLQYLSLKVMLKSKCLSYIKLMVFHSFVMMPSSR